MDAELRELVMATCREECAPWFETFGKIEDKEGNLSTPLANVYQLRSAEAIKWMRSVGLPVRLLELKPRQKGSSTYSSAELYHEGNRRPITALIVGGSHEQSGNLYRKVRTYSKYDEFQWGTSRDCNDDRARFVFPDGRETLIKRLSAGNDEVGRSDTYQFLLVTEQARWPKDGARDGAKIMAGLVKTVGNVAGTTIIIETTAKGASGDFYERYWKALTFEEFKAAFEAGENMHGKYIRIFAAWFEFPDSRIKLTLQQAIELRKSIEEGNQRTIDSSGYEADEMKKFGLNLEQMAWRRWAIDEECDHDPRQFEEDYPSTEETAFITSGSQRFNIGGLKHLRQLSKQRNPEFGIFEWNKDRSGVAWRVTSEGESMWAMCERPTVGRSFGMSVDLMTGASQNGGKDPDTHAPIVLRAGFWESGRGWRPPAEACRIRHPCIWDLDVLEEQIYRGSKFYGGCVIIPEMNMDRGLVELLKQRGDANIYVRQKFNEREFKMTEFLGWMTDKATRPRIIETLARAVREYGKEGEGMEVFSPVIIEQLEKFVRKENGREEAAAGEHDDWVLALAIALENVDFFTRYTVPMISRELPPDLRGMLGGRKIGRKPMTYA
jgi:hypothetical protein